MPQPVSMGGVLRITLMRRLGVASACIGVGMLIGINALGAFAKNVRNEVLMYSGLVGIALGLVILAAVARVGVHLPG